MKITTETIIKFSPWKKIIAKINTQHIIQETIKYYILENKKQFNSEQIINISITFTQNSDIKKINKQYRKKNEETNVIALCYNQINTLPKHPMLELGDIIVAYEYILQESKDKKISINNHTTHMIVHATLHLLGFDHQNNIQEKIMLEYENKILSKLIPN